MSVFQYRVKSAEGSKTYAVDLAAIPPELLSELITNAFMANYEYGSGAVKASNEGFFERLHASCQKIEALAVKVDDQPS